jgi:hypothetical protein
LPSHQHPEERRRNNKYPRQPEPDISSGADLQEQRIVISKNNKSQVQTWLLLFMANAYSI